MLLNLFASFTTLILVVSKVSAESYIPEENSSWTTLSPTSTISGMQTSYPSIFGIAIEPIASGSATALANQKRDASTVMQPVTQIGDGQIQGTTATTVQNNYIYITTTQSVPYTVSNTKTQTLAPTQVTTITSSCDECSTSFTVFTLGESESSTSCGGSTTYTTVIKKSTYIVASSLPACPTSSIISLTSSTIQTSMVSSSVPQSSGISSFTDNDSSSIDNGSSLTDDDSSSLTDNGSSSSSSSSSSSGESLVGSSSVSCKKAGTLTLNLQNSILKDSANRIGSVVANRQFQFDGPIPQAGAIYAAGWGIYNGNLVIGTTQVFYQCLSGSFYNLYDESIGAQCSPVYLKIVQLVDC